MKKLLIRSLVVFACLLALSFGISAQAKKKTTPKHEDSSASSFMDGVGKVGVVVVGSAAKVAWGTTKFIAKDMAVPVATGLIKPMATKMAPAAAKFAIKTSAKYLLPLAVKLSIL